MHKLRNLRLAARLGLAFGALALGLLVVSVVAFKSTDNLNTKVTALAVDVPQYTATVDGIAARLPQEGQIVAQHLYVYDGDVKAQDKVAAQFEKLAKTDTDAFAGMLKILGSAPDPETRAAVDGVKQLQQAHAALVGLYRKAIAASRAETVSADDERAGSRTLYTGQILKLQEQVNAGIAQSAQGTVEYAASEGDKAEDAIGSTKRSIIIVALISGIVSLILAVFVTRSVTGPVHQLSDRLTSLNEHCLNDLSVGLEACAEGDLTQAVVPVTTPVDVNATDELGRLSATFNEMLGKAQAAVGSYNSMRDNLGHTIGQVSNSAGTVSAASQQMAQTSDEATRAVEEIASAVNEVAQGAEKQVRVIESARTSAAEAARAAGASAETAQQTASAAGEARTVAEEGVEAANSASEAMRQVAASSQEVAEAIQELSARSERIGGIVDTITGIAEQTNLLALNAAIEAARAGEQGRGFAVVAEEVRKLAEESQSAASEIAALIGEIQAQTAQVVGVVQESARRTEDGVTTVERTRAVFEAIGAAVADVTDHVAEIAAAVDEIAAEAARAEESVGEVSAVAEESSASAEEVSASTEQTAASTQEIAASAQSLAATAEELNELVGRFKVVA